jgi:Na+-driven multidrug efflux pump
LLFIIGLQPYAAVFSFVLLWIGTLKGGNLRIKISKFTFNAEYYKEICRGGLPSLCRQGIASVAGVVFNFAAGSLGDMSDYALAASSIINRIVMFVNSAVIGFGQGFQPFCGFNYGAKLYDRVKKGYFFCLTVSTIFLAATAVVGLLFAEEIISLFRKDPEVIEFGSAVLRFQCASLPFFGLIIMGNMIMQNLGMVVKATFLATARQGIFFIPLILLLPELFGVTGLQVSQSAADILAAVCAIPLTVSVIKFLNKKAISLYF